MTNKEFWRIILTPPTKEMIDCTNRLLDMEEKMLRESWKEFMEWVTLKENKNQ